MHKDRIWTLLSRKLSGEATGAELCELTGLLNENPGIGTPVELISEYWDIPSETDEDFLEATYHLHTLRLKEAGHDLDFNKQEITGSLNIDDTINTNRRKRVLWSSSLLAAVVLALIFVLSRGSESPADLPKLPPVK